MLHSVPANQQCAFCYKLSDAVLKVCAQCKARNYCSVECQAQDWRTGHKHFCGRAGEYGRDYCVQASPGKGMGVFALRDFARGEKIMAERSLFGEIMLLRTPLFGSSVVTRQSGVGGVTVPPASQAAVDQLLPVDGSVEDKINLNSIACDGTGVKGGLFVRMSRVNHHCLGNTEHFFVAKRGVMVLSASFVIKRGQEITFAYKGLGNVDDFKRRRQNLKKVFGFDCACEVCTTSKLSSRILACLERDDQIFELISESRMEEAIRVGMKQLAEYDAIGMPLIHYGRTYYDLFQAAIAKEQFVDQGRVFVRKSAEYMVMLCGEGNDDDIEQKLAYAERPELHRNYLLCDRADRCGVQ
jgi:hypothetical protein